MRVLGGMESMLLAGRQASFNIYIYIYICNCRGAPIIGDLSNGNVEEYMWSWSTCSNCPMAQDFK
jgi:hypothetical protein